MSASNVTVKAEPLTQFAAEILTAGGAAEDAAAIWADVLVWANLRGVDSHGVLRLPRYVHAMRIGEINPRPKLEIVNRTGAIVVIDADQAPGPFALTRAMDEAIEHARRYHVGWCSVRNVTHGGAIGYYAQQAAKKGFAGIVMTASRPMMAYPGARAAAAATNPLAIALPGGAHPPLMLDMSTATASLGKILEARDAGAAIPEGWGVDNAGRTTTDPGTVAALLPMGGAKGAGLSIMIECLASLIVGNPLVTPYILPGAKASGYPHNGVAIAIDIAAFTDIQQYGADIDALADAITNLPKADGVDEIYAPGERGDAILANRRQHGIPLAQRTWERIEAVANRLGIDMPETV